MKLKLDGAGAGKHANRLPMTGLGLGTLTPESADAVLTEDIRWTQADAKQSVKSRHDRISTVAYYLSEARGFEPGHDEEDWLLAQSTIDALDAGAFSKL
jgi:Protein of unknown function (DUF2934)